MRNNTNAYCTQATPQQILGKLNGSALGSQQENKKKTVQASRLLKANSLFQIDPTYGKLTSVSIVSIIIQKELVMCHGNSKIWKEPGLSTVQNSIYRMLHNKELPIVRAEKALNEGKYYVCKDSVLVNPDVIRNRLLSLSNWDLKNNIPEWYPHKVKKQTGPKLTRRPQKVGFFKRLKYLFFPKSLLSR